MVPLAFVRVPVSLDPTLITPVLVPPELPSINVPPPVRVALELPNFKVPCVRLMVPEFVRVPLPVISSVDPLPSKSTVPELLKVAIFTKSVPAASPPPP